MNIMNTNFKTIAITLLVGILALSLTSGCKNTAHGAGEDIEKIGEKIQDKTN